MEIWRRQDANTAIRYTCFEELGATRFYVKSADFFRQPLDHASVTQLNTQMIELSLDFLTCPEERDVAWSESIEGAIQVFDRDFDN
jgi:hypothetical protein